MKQQIEFEGYDIHLQTFKSNKDSFRVLIDCGMDSWEVIKEIPTLPLGVYKITIEPVYES